jgi:hypothetical protein
MVAGASSEVGFIGVSNQEMLSLSRNGIATEGAHRIALLLCEFAHSAVLPALSQLSHL